MLEWLRQNMRDMNRTVKWVMKKKTSQVNERKQVRGQLWRSGWYVWEVDGEVETTGIQSQTCKWNWTEGTELREREVYHLKMPWSRKEFDKKWHSEELVGQVHSQLERWWQEIRMEKTGWRCDFKIYSLCKGKLPKALSWDVVWLWLH